MSEWCRFACETKGITIGCEYGGLCSASRGLDQGTMPPSLAAAMSQLLSFAPLPRPAGDLYRPNVIRVGSEQVNAAVRDRWVGQLVEAYEQMEQGTWQRR